MRLKGVMIALIIILVIWVVLVIVPLIKPGFLPREIDEFFKMPLITDIIVAIIMFVLGVGAKRIYNYHRLTRPFNRVWRLKDEESNQIYVVTGSIPHDTYKHLMACGDVDAYAEIAACLRRQVRKAKIKSFFSPEFPTKFLDENIVSIGGPVWNKVTQNFMKQSGCPIDYDLKDRCFVDVKTGRRFYNQVVGGNGIDYGLIIHSANPYDTSKMVVLFIGGYTYGVLAGARYMSPFSETGSNSLRALSKRIQKTNSYCVLLKVEVINNTPTKINEEIFYTFERKEL